MNTSSNIELHSVKIIDRSSNWSAVTKNDLEELRMGFNVQTEEEIEHLFASVNLDELTYRPLQLFAKLKGLRANADLDTLRLLLKSIQSGVPVDETHYRKDEREPRKKVGFVAGAIAFIILVVLLYFIFGK